MAFEMTNAANRTRVKDTQTKALMQHYGDVMRGNRPDAAVNHARREQYAKDMERNWEVQNRSKAGGPSHSDFHRNNYDKTIAIAEKMANDNKLKQTQGQAGTSTSAGTSAS